MFYYLASREDDGFADISRGLSSSICIKNFPAAVTCRRCSSITISEDEHDRPRSSSYPLCKYIRQALTSETKQKGWSAKYRVAKINIAFDPLRIHYFARLARSKLTDVTCIMTTRLSNILDTKDSDKKHEAWFPVAWSIVSFVEPLWNRCGTALVKWSAGLLGLFRFVFGFSYRLQPDAALLATIDQSFSVHLSICKAAGLFLSCQVGIASQRVFADPDALRSCWRWHSSSAPVKVHQCFSNSSTVRTANANFVTGQPTHNSSDEIRAAND